MKKIIAYPGTFDPVTKGHESVIQRAAKIFDEVVVLVAKGVHKSPLFSLAERQEMLLEVIADIPKVTVAPLPGLLADYLASNNIKLVLRGLRTVSDYELEIQLADINRQLGKEVETLFIAPDTKFIHVASHLVREIAELGGDVSHYVHPKIASRLQDKFNK